MKRLSMFSLLTESALFASHQRLHGGGGNLAVLWVFLGVLASAGWLIFSELPFRTTVAVTAVGWVAVTGLSYDV
jgi:hypothetical protein